MNLDILHEMKHSPIYNYCGIPGHGPMSKRWRGLKYKPADYPAPARHYSAQAEFETNMRGM